jgi:hypothetical protein
MSLIPFGFWAASGAGGGAGAFDLLETTTLSTSASSVTFSGLDTLAAGYKHLQVRIVATAPSGSGSANLRLTFNSDTGANYSEHVLYGDGATVNASAGANRSNIDLAGIMAAGSTDIFGAGIVDILDFSSAQKNKTIRSLHGNKNSSNQYVYLESGAWYNTSAITSMNFTWPSNIAAGSRFSLIGIK